MKKENMEGKQFPDLNEAVKQGKTVFGFIVHEEETEVICKGKYGEITRGLAQGLAQTIIGAGLGPEEFSKFSIKAMISYVSLMSEAGEKKDEA